jgi:hypothetical protein
VSAFAIDPEGFLHIVARTRDDERTFELGRVRVDLEDFSWTGVTDVTCAYAGAWYFTGNGLVNHLTLAGRDALMTVFIGGTSDRRFGQPVIRWLPYPVKPYPGLLARLERNPSTARRVEASITLPSPARVSSRIYDVTGREIQAWSVPADEGTTTLAWTVDTSLRLGFGVYFWVLDAGPLGRQVLRVVRR